jgi:hypothetical protein
MTIKNYNKSLEKTFDTYGKLFINIIINLLQVAILFILFICIVSLSNKDKDQLYPTNLNSSFYVSTNYNCDLDGISSNESAFCKENKEKINTINNNNNKSKYSKELIQKGLYIGYENGSLTEILSFLFYYLLFRMEYFLNCFLNGSHNMVSSFFKNPILVFISIIPLMGIINGVSQKFIFPFLTKLFNMKPNNNSGTKMLTNIPIHIFITLFCFFSLVFVFLIVPSIFYFIYLLLNTLGKTLSNVINIVCVFLIYMCINSLYLFLKFMESKYKNSFKI